MDASARSACFVAAGHALKRFNKRSALVAVRSTNLVLGAWCLVLGARSASARRAATNACLILQATKNPPKRVFQGSQSDALGG